MLLIEIAILNLKELSEMIAKLWHLNAEIREHYRCIGIRSIKLKTLNFSISCTTLLLFNRLVGAPEEDALLWEPVSHPIYHCQPRSGRYPYAAIYVL